MSESGLTVMRQGITTPNAKPGNGHSFEDQPEKLAALLRSRHKLALDGWRKRLAQRALLVLRGEVDPLESERDQSEDDARLVSLLRHAERLDRGTPLV